MPTRVRRRAAQLVAPPDPAPQSDRPEEPVKKTQRPPTLLDFYPFEAATETRIAHFFDELRAGRLATTRCRRDRTLLWPPRVVCPKCHSEDLEWIELPRKGRLYAFSAVLAGAPLGMEGDVPFAVGLADLDGAPLRLFGRIVGAPWNALRVGQAVSVEPFDVGDGRVFYRFRAAAPR